MSNGSALKQALHFVGIAGIGWLADNCVFYLIVATASGSPFIANFIGGLCGATVTFLSARERLFERKSGRTWVRLGGYLVYTLALLVAASAAVQSLTSQTAGWWPAVELRWHALGAKLAVTPFTLISNYVVARFMSTR